MKADRVLKEYAGTPLDQLPQDVQELLQSDEALASEFEAQARVAAMMALKRYETPDEAMFGRVHYRTQLQIIQQVNTRSPALFTQWPAWARVTAVVLFMLGLSVLTHREMLRTEQEDPVVASPASDPFEPLPPLVLSGSDPFAPYVFKPSESGVDEFPSALTRKLESDFEALGLTETNAHGANIRLPVLFPAAP